jgi:hypothetical protein
VAAEVTAAAAAAGGGGGSGSPVPGGTVGGGVVASCEGGRLEGVILRSQLLVLLQRRHFCDQHGRPVGREYDEKEEIELEVRAGCMLHYFDSTTSVDGQKRAWVCGDVSSCPSSNRVGGTESECGMHRARPAQDIGVSFMQHFPDICVFLTFAHRTPLISLPAVAIWLHLLHPD